jgi:hypothetical protein
MSPGLPAVEQTRRATGATEAAQSDTPHRKPFPLIGRLIYGKIDMIKANICGFDRTGEE